MNRLQVIDTCDKHWNPSAATLYHISHRTIEKSSSGSWVYDEEGNRYLDSGCSYGVFIVGHGNVVGKERVTQQVRRMGMRPYGVTDSNTPALMKKLASILPGDLERFVFTNSGAEASEVALRIALAAQYPRKKIVAIENSYHGKTLGALNILGQRNHRTHFSPTFKDVQFVPFGDIVAMKDAIGDGAAAVFIEPVLGGPYLQIPPAGYLKQVEVLCRNTGTLLVADEIQTAFGRAGSMFGVDYDKVTPDMMILSKGLTGGHAAVAALTISRQLAEIVDSDKELSASFTGSGSGASPFSMAAALAALEVIMDDDLPARAVLLGTRLLSGMRKIASQYPKLILDVPGIGLMTGLKVRNPAIETAITVVIGRKGVHVGHSMNESAKHPVLRFYPPLTVTEEEIDRCLGALEETLKQVASRPLIAFDILNQIIKRQYRLPRWFLFKLAGVKEK